MKNCVCARTRARLLLAGESGPLKLFRVMKIEKTMPNTVLIGVAQAVNASVSLICEPIKRTADLGINNLGLSNSIGP